MNADLGIAEPPERGHRRALGAVAGTPGRSGTPGTDPEGAL